MSFEGVLLIDKPRDMTSHDVVAQVRKALNERRVGHAGTLDPLATGLLVILVGKATRLSDYLLNGQKTYEAEVALGSTTDTLDAEGKVLTTWQGSLPDSNRVREIALSTYGDLELKVPQYSAVKVQGKKLYETARKGEETPEVYRTMTFSQPQWREGGGNTFKVEISCAKGGFIRAWADEVGRRLEVGGHLKNLRRTCSAPYSLEQALPLAELESLALSNKSLKGVKAAIPLSLCLLNAPGLKLSPFEEKMILNGKIPPNAMNTFLAQDQKVTSFRLLGTEGELLAVLRRTQAFDIKIGCVFN